MRANRCLSLLLASLALACSGCSKGPPDAAQADTNEDAPTTPTNRIEIPPSVRRDLGITFVEVEARRVEQTLRVPGRFEYRRTATSC